MRALHEPLVFVDIETTGLSPTSGRVIEVAAIRVQNGEVVQELNKLIDPGTELSRFTTQLTGITDDDLRVAPVFEEIAEELHQILDGAVFVAHNVNFDYSFLKQEFARIGRDFDPLRLCTVRLSRALYPEYKSHKLANLIERHGFSYAARHRAYDDANVLWQFLQHAETAFERDILLQAIAKQVKLPLLSKTFDEGQTA
jgi:DNA polymerase-3 subunit epsilon